jgi:hypothetical protein
MVATWAGRKHGLVRSFGRQCDVKNPDEEILCKMSKLAQRLSAKVQGDDGEVYDTAGRVT